MTRWYGVAHDTASSTFKSFDPSRFMVYFLDEDDPEKRTATTLNAHAARVQKVFDDERTVVAVVKGSEPFLRDARRTLSSLFEAVALASDVETLRKLNVKIIDDGWKQGDQQLVFDDIMARPDPEAERP